MTATKIVVPDYQFTGFYYAEILRRIRLFNRVNAPEITSELAEEPFIQGERAFALVGHLNNVLADLAANENFLPTAKLQDSVRALLALIDYQLRDFSPATVELLSELTQVATSSVQVMEENALFETRKDDENESIPFEAASSTIGPTNVVDAVFGVEFVRSGVDGGTIVGDPDAFESDSMAVGAVDVDREIEIVGSIFGNNGVFRIEEVLQTGATSRIRLGPTLGGETPNFIVEPDLTWTIRAYTANAETAVNSAGAPFFDPWVDVSAGDKLYVGSSWVMWDELAIALQPAGFDYTGVWEYYDPDSADENPDVVTNEGSFLRFDVTTLLGTIDVHGALVRVTHLPSGISEVIPSGFAALTANYVDVSAFLGQSGTPSTDPEDYAVGVDWNPLPDVVDDSFTLFANGALTYSLPQTLHRNWKRIEIAGIEGWFVRLRIVAASSGNEPTIDTLAIDGGRQYLLFDATQGETVANEPTSSSNGQPGQTFELSTIPGLRDSVRTFVDEGGGEIEWVNVTARGDRLLSYGSKDRVFAVAQDSTGKLTVKVGDGDHGRIPPLGVDNVRFEYRVSAVTNGNVGAETVVVNSAGAALLKSVTNPRPGSGWREADGASEESLALVKEEGPASLRTGNRASAPQDYVDLALAFTAENGTRPVVRAKAIEEGFGPKTIKLVVVGTNGVAIPDSVRTELETYFNGDESEGVEGVGQANVETTVVNFIPRLFGVTVAIEATSALSETLVRTRLVTLINPTARSSNGLNWLWRFGGRVPTSRIESEIFGISPGNVFDVDVSVPTADVEMFDDELPLLDTSSLNVSIVAPSY